MLVKGATGKYESDIEYLICWIKISHNGEINLQSSSTTPGTHYTNMS